MDTIKDIVEYAQITFNSTTYRKTKNLIDLAPLFVGIGCMFI